MDILKKKNLKNSIDRILIKYPDKIPVFVYRNNKDKSLIDLKCSKFIVPESITIAQFMVIIRKRLKIESEQALFVFINNNIPVSSESMRTIYEKYKNKDGMLMIEYCGENVFG